MSVMKLCRCGHRKTHHDERDKKNVGPCNEAFCKCTGFEFAVRKVVRLPDPEVVKDCESCDDCLSCEIRQMRAKHRARKAAA